MSKLWRRLVRQGLRRGWERGVLDGNRAWIVIGGAALLAHLFGRYGGRETDVIFSHKLGPGEAIRITHEAPE
ncbi:MAG: hypothetical protein J2P57_22915 [Acidimicrobiaceae bacterium]|nr:hypothetical protein [Acidimicrobiaceae bacterium]